MDIHVQYIEQLTTLLSNAYGVDDISRAITVQHFNANFLSNCGIESDPQQVNDPKVLSTDSNFRSVAQEVTMLKMVEKFGMSLMEFMDMDVALYSILVEMAQEQDKREQTEIIALDGKKGK